jgi:tetratricopeptide (TPR) repeat protein
MTQAADLGYSTHQTARLLGVTPRRVRGYVEAGFVSSRRGARGEHRFSFQDLVVLRVVRDLAAARLPGSKIRAALDRLRRELPRGRSLSAVRLTAEGGEVVVRAGGEAWEPASGQRLLDFEVAELAAEAAPIAHRAARRAQDGAGDGWSAEEWFDLGCELEPTAPEEAREAYRRALALDPEHADAHLNLGRLLHEAGDPLAAETHYRRAADIRPSDATAAYNLGVALQDLHRPADAVAAYCRAVAADPDYADAYFNLAGLYEELGKRAAAIRSLKIYKSLTEG